MMAAFRSGQMETGSTLLLSLVLLSALTLLGWAAASDYQLQTRVGANQAQAAEAEGTAELTLNWAEHWLLSLQGDRRPEACAAECARHDVIRTESSFPAAPAQAELSWWQVNGHAPGQEPVSGDRIDPDTAKLEGLWIIGEIEIPADARGADGDALGYYRVIARGQDSTARQTAVTESIVARPWGDAAWSNALPPGATPGFCQREALAPCGRLAWRKLH